MLDLNLRQRAELQLSRCVTNDIFFKMATSKQKNGELWKQKRNVGIAEFERERFSTLVLFFQLATIKTVFPELLLHGSRLATYFL